jgi:hypothetical protein
LSRKKGRFAAQKKKVGRYFFLAKKKPLMRAAYILKVYS